NYKNSILDLPLSNIEIRVVEKGEVRKEGEDFIVIKRPVIEFVKVGTKQESESAKSSKKENVPDSAIGNNIKTEKADIEAKKAEIERINKEYNNKIQNLKKQLPNQSSTKSEVDQLKERLESTMKEDYYPLQYVGEDYDEMVKNKPSEEDV